MRCLLPCCKISLGFPNDHREKVTTFADCSDWTVNSCTGSKNDSFEAFQVIALIDC